MFILFAWAWKVSFAASHVEMKKKRTGENQCCSQRKARKSGGAGERFGATSSAASDPLTAALHGALGRYGHVLALEERGYP